ncbi:hypothetical protein MUP59_00360 [Candidatus Bathyarchaeota archaeon]|nr:hypothetical protein [Candidatus Bathyarchaeota archaeon]
MKLLIVKKGGSGSGDFGHSGRPGLQGGSSGGSGGANPYEGKSFKDASHAVMQDAIAGVVRGPWVVSAESAYMALPEGGKATIRIESEHFVTGKYVAGTTSQQRYKVGVEIATYQRNTGSDKERRPFSRWDANWLYSKKVKPEGTEEAREKARKRFSKLFE